MTDLEQEDRIFSGVAHCIQKATGIKIQRSDLAKTLVNDLQIDSIDMIDLLYQMEDEFSVQLKFSEFEKQARQMMGDKPFAIDNVISAEGLEILRKLMPEAPPEKFTPGFLVQQIPYLLTVQSLCRLVKNKLDQQ